MIDLLTSANIRDMQIAGRVAAEVLKDLGGFIKFGISTKDIELFFDERLNKNLGMNAAFKGYSGFPASICVSINEEVIHGIPSTKRIIKDGDLVGVDLGIKYNGVFVDSAYTYMVGSVTKEARKLCEVTQEALAAGIKKVYSGSTIGDIGAVVEYIVSEHGFSVVRQFVGHGIGKDLHMPPEVPNFGESGTSFRLHENMAIAVEPMVNMGRHEVDVLRDGWTVRTKDWSLSAHYEHTVVVTNNGPLIVTI